MKSLFQHRRVFVLILLFQATDASGAEVDYLRQIKPVLRERCYACHGSLKQEADLRLDTGALVRQGGSDGPVVTPGDPDQSKLIARINSNDEGDRMPPVGKPLTAEEVALIRAWITAGAPSPKEEQPEADPEDHWAFQIPIRPPLPESSDPDRSRNPIDAFLQAAYDRHGLTPAPEATPAQRLRRVSLDLVGLPPSAEQVREFLKNPSPEAYVSYVDDLLDSPLYGERWARHWMDVWRYSDWYGRRQQNDVRNSAPQIWRWRDWIVQSLNRDKSYAQMIREMLAADEISPHDDSEWPATGYLIRNYYSLNPNEWMRHCVEYTGKAFLGLTFNCAHCHDHKYDPIAHDDYFRMRAFFEPMGIRQDRVLGEPEPPPFQPYVYSGSRKVVRLGMVRIYDETPEAPTWFYTDGDERNKVKDRGSIAPGVPAFLNVPLAEIEPVDLPMSAWYPGSRPHIQQAILEERQNALTLARQKLQQVLESPVDTAPLEAKVQRAQQAFDEALADAVAAGESGALAGDQSLLLEASTGRRLVQNTLPKLNTVPSGTTISFRLRILRDGHVNFQLARDTTKHLTALYVGFVDGTIRSYQPGGFQEFEVGSYNHRLGQDDLTVRLVIQPVADTALLSVRVTETDTVLAEDVSIALNGWDPSKNPHQPMTFDCRSGTEALIDDVTVTAGEQQFFWDFEAPTFSDGEDIGGIAGWMVNASSVPPARSVVSMIAGCESARTSYEALQESTTALQALTVTQDAAERGVQAAELRLLAAEKTIAADNAAREGAASARINELAQAARRMQLSADEADARWRILDTQHKRNLAAALPDEDDSKSKQLADLDKQLMTARSDLAEAVGLQENKAAPPSTEYTRFSPTTSPTSTGRRSALANWITDKRNPLTPRVAVNHLWMRHFHAPLVESVYDFGRNGKLPTHPRLLDWLAVEFMENGWSMKHIHRLIVTSKAYRMSSSSKGLGANREVDKDNRYLWRMNRGRMESEVVRDSLLFIAGKLDTAQGGPPLLNTLAMTTYRRSLYYEVFPEDGGHSKLSEIFDAPDPTRCFRSGTSTFRPSA